MSHKILVPGPGALVAEMIRRKVANWPRFSFMVSRHETTEQAIMAGNYDQADGQINGRNFPLRPRSDGYGLRAIELVESNHNITPSEAIIMAARFGLKQPLYEDAFDFGELYPKEQRGRRIVFPHEPWLDPSGNLKVIMLDGDAHRRNLRLRSFNARCRRGWAFAFVKKED